MKTLRMFVGILVAVLLVSAAPAFAWDQRGGGRNWQPQPRGNQSWNRGRQRDNVTIVNVNSRDGDRFHAGEFFGGIGVGVVAKEIFDEVFPRRRVYGQVYGQGGYRDQDVVLDPALVQECRDRTRTLQQYNACIDGLANKTRELERQDVRDSYNLGRNLPRTGPQS